MRKSYTTGCGKISISLDEDSNGNAFKDVTIKMGKGGGCASCQNEAVSRLVEINLKNNIHPLEIAKQLHGIVCHNATDTIKSCADATGQAIKHLWEKFEASQVKT